MGVKPYRLLVLSLTVNVALGLIWFVLLRTSPISLMAKEDVVIPVPAKPPTLKVISATDVSATPTAPPFNWHRIESTDYRRYMANLRAIGCPEWLIRDIIVSDIDALPVGQTSISAMPLPPWANADRRRARELSERNRSAAVQEIKHAAIQQLLGCEWNYRSGDIFTRGPNQEIMYGFLPDDKAGKLVALIEKYKLQASTIRESVHEILIPEDFTRLRELQQRVDVEAAQFLTPTELEEFKLRTQAVGYLFQSEVWANGVSLSGSEFRELAGISRILKDAFAALISDDKQPSAKEMEERDRVFQQQLESLLGRSRLSAGIFK